MTLFYLDSSAWVKRHFREPGSSWINGKFAEGVLFGASTLGLLEVMATCARKLGAAATGEASFQQIEADVLDDWSGFFQMELTPDVVERSLDVARLHALRGADSVQLASGSILREKPTLDANEFAMVTSDLELKAAARKAGFFAIDPQEQTDPSGLSTA